jgi:DNA mismatch repair protein MutS
MLETAAILQHATERSLIILDEVGRGTSTEDGVAIATAVVEHLAVQVCARTLFATHFRELAHACTRIPGTCALQTAVAQEDGRIVFLHTIVPGVADAALGLEIARLAGIPATVLERAKSVVPRPPATVASLPPPSAAELARDRIMDELLDIDIATTTPLKALVQLAELQARLRAADAETLGPRALEAAEARAVYGRAD